MRVITTGRSGIRKSLSEPDRAAYRFAGLLVVSKPQFQLAGFLGGHFPGDVPEGQPVQFALVFRRHYSSSNSCRSFSTANRMRVSTVPSGQPSSLAMAANV